jgi:hypothetical protein
MKQKITYTYTHMYRGRQFYMSYSGELSKNYTRFRASGDYIGYNHDNWNNWAIDNTGILTGSLPIKI